MKCKKCGTEKDGSSCKVCQAAWYKEYRRKNPEKIEAWRIKGYKKYISKEKNRRASTKRSTAWRQAHPEETMLALTKYRAKKLRIPFNLTLDDITIPLLCPVLGTPLSKDRKRQSSPSIDQIIPGLGYVKGNVQIISAKANTMKNSANCMELLKFAEWIRKTYAATKVSS